MSPEDTHKEREARSVALERTYVHDVYDHISANFSSSRCRTWPKVRNFLSQLDRGAVVADVGCGIGKYLGVNSHVVTVGVDRCATLAQRARQKNRELMISDNLALPFRDECFDAGLSIAVIHHFATTERRVRALRELSRIIRIGGKLMISVWAMEQKNRKFESQDVLVPWHRPAHSACDGISEGTDSSSTDEDGSSLSEKSLPKRRFVNRVSSRKRARSQPELNSSSRSSMQEGHSSQGSSEISSPNESCYSFVRRALQKLTSGRRATSSPSKSWLLSSSGFSTLKSEWTKSAEKLRNEHNLREDGVGDNMDDIPIELRHLEPDDPSLLDIPSSATFVKINAALEEQRGVKSKSLSNLLKAAPSLNESFYQLPSVRDLSNKLESHYDSKSEVTTSDGSLTSLPLSSSSGSVATGSQSSESDPKPSRRRPTLVKQKTSLNESDIPIIIQVVDIDKPNACSSSSQNEEYLTVPKVILKQRSLNDEFICLERFIEREKIKQSIQKQRSLNEDLLYGNKAKWETLRENMFKNQIKKLKTIRENIQRIRSVSLERFDFEKPELLKSGIMKLLQQWKKEWFVAKSNRSECKSDVQQNEHNSLNSEKRVSEKKRAPLLHRLKGCKNSFSDRDKSFDGDILSNPERKVSREESSDSSKENSFQSDTSLDSEDSCVSVIYVPKPGEKGIEKEGLPSSESLENLERQHSPKSPKSPVNRSAIPQTSLLFCSAETPVCPITTNVLLQNNPCVLTASNNDKEKKSSSSLVFSSDFVHSTLLTNSKNSLDSLEMVKPKKENNKESKLSSFLFEITGDKISSIPGCLLMEDTPIKFNKTSLPTSYLHLSSVALTMTSQAAATEKISDMNSSCKTVSSKGSNQRYLTFEVFNPETDDLDSESSSSTSSASGSSVIEKGWPTEKEIEELDREIKRREAEEILRPSPSSPEALIPSVEPPKMSLVDPVHRMDTINEEANASDYGNEDSPKTKQFEKSECTLTTLSSVAASSDATEDSKNMSSESVGVKRAPELCRLTKTEMVDSSLENKVVRAKNANTSDVSAEFSQELGLRQNIPHIQCLQPINSLSTNLTCQSKNLSQNSSVNCARCTSPRQLSLPIADNVNRKLTRASLAQLNTNTCDIQHDIPVDSELLNANSENVSRCLSKRQPLHTLDNSHSAETFRKETIPPLSPKKKQEARKKSFELPSLILSSLFGEGSVSRSDRGFREKSDLSFSLDVAHKCLPKEKPFSFEKFRGTRSESKTALLSPDEPPVVNVGDAKFDNNLSVLSKESLIKPECKICKKEKERKNKIKEDNLMKKKVKKFSDKKMSLRSRRDTLKPQGSLDSAREKENLSSKNFPSLTRSGSLDFESSCGKDTLSVTRDPSLSTSQDSLQSDMGGAPTLHRYYHVFREGELDHLIEKYVHNLHIISSYYDHANWCVIAEKVRVWTI